MVNSISRKVKDQAVFMFGACLAVAMGDPSTMGIIEEIETP